MHADLERSSQEVVRILNETKRFLEDEERASSRDLDKLLELVAAKHAVINALPVAVADRLEHMLDRINDTVDKKIDGVLVNVRISLEEVREKLWQFAKTSRKFDSGEVQHIVDTAIEKSGNTATTDTMALSGSLTQSGTVNLVFQAEWVKKLVFILKWAFLAALASGGIAGFWKAIEAIVGK